MSDTQLFLAATLLTWATLQLGSVLRTRSWTRAGQKLAFGNRDDMPEPSPLAGRAERAARNNLENLVLFASVWAAARLGGAAPAPVLLGTQLFFWSRCAYTAVYLAGIPYLRTAMFAVGMIGTFIVGVAALG
jgi:uncharacterized MAPEG superfamily protein